MVHPGSNTRSSQISAQRSRSPERSRLCAFSVPGSTNCLVTVGRSRRPVVATVLAARQSTNTSIGREETEWVFRSLGLYDHDKRCTQQRWGSVIFFSFLRLFVFSLSLARWFNVLFRRRRGRGLDIVRETAAQFHSARPRATPTSVQQSLVRRASFSRRLSYASRLLASDSEDSSSRRATAGISRSVAHRDT